MESLGAYLPECMRDDFLIFGLWIEQYWQLGHWSWQGASVSELACWCGCKLHSWHLAQRRPCCPPFFLRLGGWYIHVICCFNSNGWTVLLIVGLFCYTTERRVSICDHHKLQRCPWPVHHMSPSSRIGIARAHGDEFNMAESWQLLSESPVSICVSAVVES